MKQRVRVVGIIETLEGILLLRQNKGRAEELPTWELPTGKIQFGEQPEEAMSRAIFEYLGAGVKEMKLIDVVTFVGLVGASRAGNLYIIYKVELEAGAKIHPSERYHAYRYVKEKDLASLVLEDASKSVMTIELEDAGKPLLQNRKNREERQIRFREAANGATVYVDGSSHGNPGPAGVGYYIVDEYGHVVRRGGEFVGFAGSRVAEYFALKEGCRQALDLGLKHVRFVSDSLMMVNQMNGVYPVKNRDLLPIHADIQKMLEQFEAVAFVHVKRELNREADLEANLAIARVMDR